MEAIFVSYRRSDSEGQAGRLFQNLVEAFGPSSVLFDVARLEKGRDFRQSFEHRLQTCRVLLAVIGRGWISAKADDGTRRLDNSQDLVRIEIAAALRRDIAVIPVLVGGASMPRAGELPDSLKELMYRDGVELTHARWDSDVQLLIDALRPHLANGAPLAGGAPPRNPTPAAVASGQAGTPAARLGIGVVVLGALGFGGWQAYQQLSITRAGDTAATQRGAQQASAGNGVAVNASDGSIVTVGPAANVGLGSVGSGLKVPGSPIPGRPVNQSAQAGNGGTAINASGQSQVHVGKP